MISNTTETVPALRNYPSKLFVETTTQCNLRCPMCVKQAKDSCINVGNMDMEIYDCLKPAFPFVQALVLNGIGEPLIHPHIIDFIHSARQLMPDDGWIGFQSNGLLLDKKCADLLVRSGLDRLCLSVDGIKPEIFNAARKGEQLSDIERALSFLAIARRKVPATRLRVGIEFVVMEMNKTELTTTLRWAANHNVDFAIVSQALPYSLVSTSQLAYSSSSDMAVEIFAKWKNKMAKMGLDIYQYNTAARSTGLFTMPSCDPQLAKVIRMVDEMRAEARLKNVFLDIPSLMQRNPQQAKDLRNIFIAAQKVADDVGIELKLPSFIPEYERRCPFVEDGSAFVSWDGHIHPCYFLWHQYRSFLNDWDRIVKPRVFGRLGEKQLLEIWQSSDFVQFRHNVLKFDYPYCSNCSVAPCDLAQAEDFDHDCFSQTEPCGSCPWATGILQCLQ